MCIQFAQLQLDICINLIELASQTYINTDASHHEYRRQFLVLSPLIRGIRPPARKKKKKADIP